jgi:hypothetical protein
MKNYNFETRPMTLVERKDLEDGRLNPWKVVKYGLIALCVFALSAYISGTALPTKNDLRFILAFIPITITFFMFIHWVNRQIEIDLNDGCLYIAYAKLEDIMTSEYEDYMGFVHVFEYEKKHLYFQLSPKTLINTKAFKKPITFVKADKVKLRLTLKKNQIYRLTFALNTEHLFSMEEV